MEEEGEERPKTAASKAASAAGTAASAESEVEEKGKEIWTDVPDYKFELEASLSIDEYRLQVVPSIAQEEKPDDTGENPDVENEDEKKDEDEELIPICADGSKSLNDLKFGPEMLDPPLIDLRKRTFEFIQINYDRVMDKAIETLAIEEENISTLLNQRLRRHGNRQGKVQVEWFQPRKNEIEKHKIKFERHLISVAQKHAGHEDLFEEILSGVEAIHSAYVERLDKIREKAKVAGSHNELSGYERRARKDILGSFQSQLAEITENLQNLATKAPSDLEKQNESFLNLCKASFVENPTLETPVDMYSVSEMEYYKGELEVLNGKLREKAKERQEKLDEFHIQKEKLINEPFNDFLVFYEETKKNMVVDWRKLR